LRQGRIDGSKKIDVRTSYGNRTGPKAEAAR
jgi:hypothetical protein